MPRAPRPTPPAAGLGSCNVFVRKEQTMPRKNWSSRRYGQKASDKVERAMHEMKRGQLKSGRSGKTVKSREQAIAIGLSEARRAGGKVPSRPNGRSRARGAGAN